MATYGILPGLPSRGQNGWDTTVNAFLDAVRNLTIDVPEMQGTMSGLAVRVGKAETALTQTTASVTTLQASASAAATQASDALAAATRASNAAAAAQTAAQAASTDAKAAAASADQLADQMNTGIAEIGALQRDKADTSALATVALTGQYADLIGAPGTGGIIPTRSTTTRPTTDPKTVVVWHTPTPPVDLMLGADYWVPTP